MMLNRYAQLFGGPDPRMGGSLGAPSMPQPPQGAANNGDLAQQWYRQHTGYLPGSPMADGVQPQMSPPQAPPHAGVMPQGVMPQGYDFGQRFGLMQQAMRAAPAPSTMSPGRMGVGRQFGGY